MPTNKFFHPLSLRLGGLLFSYLFATACGGGTANTDATDTAGTTDTSDTDTGSETAGPEIPAGCDLFVAASDGQQALVGTLIDAPDGSVVCLGEGEFVLDEELAISGNGITLRGAGEDKTSFTFDKENYIGANGLIITGDDVTVEHFAVIDAPGDGIVASGVENITYQNITAAWPNQYSMDNGAYGLYPVQATHVTIRNCTVYGARDAGIYVGQSTDILVEDSVAYDNVAGIEIENSTGATVRNNHAYGNTAGLLIFNLPGLEVQDGKQTVAYDNLFEDNNVPNWGVPGTAVAAVPYGVGIMIMASDFNEIRDNEIRNNDTVGVVIFGYHDFIFEPVDDPNYDILAEGNYIHSNLFIDNGQDPDLQVLVLAGNPPLPAPEIGWDGCVDAEKDNSDGRYDTCLWENGDARFMNLALCGGEKTEDINTVTCQHTPLPDLPPGY